MHQEAYQDASHCHQDRVVVHTLQAYREGRKMEHSRSSVAGASGRLSPLVFLHKGKPRPGLHSMAVLALLQCRASRSLPGSRRVTTRSNRFLSAVTRFSTWFSSCEGRSLLVDGQAHHVSYPRVLPSWPR